MTVDINKDGGPAFPVSIPGVGDNGWHGMTLRDWFAGMAMQGMCAAYPPGTTFKEVAEKAYRMADAMLVAQRSTR